MLSSTTYVGNGVTTQFNVPFLYVRKFDVTATIGGVPATFSWFDDSTIQFTNPPADGVTVKITRSTDVTQLAVDFVDGANVVAADLDKAYRHTLFYAQELKERQDFYIAYWDGLIVGGGDLPPSDAANEFLIGDGAGNWNVKTLAETKTILGVDDLEAVTGVPDPDGQFGFFFTDGTTWKVLGQKPTRDVLHLGDMAIHNIDDFSKAILTPVGVATGNLVQLVNVSGDPGLPAVDGSLLTNVSREEYVLLWESAAYNVGGGAYPDHTVWATKTLTDKVVDETGDISLSSGMVEIPAGKYRVRVRSKVQIAGHCFCRVTTDDGTVIATGWGVWNNDDECVAECFFVATLPACTLRVQVRCTGDGGDGNALGRPHGVSGLGNNVYTIFELWKLPI